MRKIYLTRHGESLYNIENRIGGNPDLSDKGYDYANKLSKYINNLDDNINILTSKMTRTINTSTEIKFNKIRYDCLNEINAGICENMTYDEVSQKFPNEFSKRNADKLNYKYPEGESYRDLINRVQPILDIINNSNDTILIIAHQAILRVIYGKILNMKQEYYPNIPIPLHALTEININNTTTTVNNITIINNITTTVNIVKEI
jgi:broad specificity phosphatase PhoE